MRTTTPRPAWLAVAWAAALGASGCSSSRAPPQPVTFDVSAAFPAGTVLRDQYSGTTATVSSSGSVSILPDPSGVALLERDGVAPGPFTWSGATVYFVMTDRFHNGDPGNDGSYGRTRDPSADFGTWHGGDLKGITAKLDHIAALGASAIWISPPVQQVRGWVSGGGGAFKHYGYHGYWALDFTRLDANFGTEADLTELVDAAHQRGIRVLFDVVMNHPGYATGDDLLVYLPEVFVDPTGNAFRNFVPPDGRGYDAWNDLVNYGSTGWQSWWASSNRAPGNVTTWIRAGFPGFPNAGTDDQTRQLEYLPDFVTEGTVAAGVPILFSRKAALAGETTGVTDQPGYTVRQYLVKWHSDWVRRFGIDGFRCDTAKNVELASWKALKDAGVLALQDWKAQNPAKKIDDSAFWMTGEVYGHGAVKDAYYGTGGFDSLINFNFQVALADILRTGSLAGGADALEVLYGAIASQISVDPGFDVMNYISSHDTNLFFDVVKSEPARQRQAGTALLLAPGTAQIYYGDESGRPLGVAPSEPTQGTRSDMNWSTIDSTLLAHFQKLGVFRKRHPAIGGGSHTRMASPAGTYAFARKIDTPALQDATVILLTAPR